MATSTLPLPLEFHNGEEPLTVEIPLTKGFTTFVDAIDSDLALQKWCVCTKKHYAVKSDTKTLLHRIILQRILGRELAQNEHVDHINGNTRDNRRSNLRLATNQQNTMNGKRRSSNTSGYKGVTYEKRRNHWIAQIMVNGKHIQLGSFGTPEEAHKAYCDAATKYFGEFANFG